MLKSQIPPPEKKLFLLFFLHTFAIFSSQAYEPVRGIKPNDKMPKKMNIQTY